MRVNGQNLLEPVLVSTREPFRLFWRVNGPKVALSQVFCCVQVNSVLKLLLSPLLTHKMLLQNYEENIKWNLAGRTIHNNFCFFFSHSLRTWKNWQILFNPVPFSPSVYIQTTLIVATDVIIQSLITKLGHLFLGFHWCEDKFYRCFLKRCFNSATVPLQIPVVESKGNQFSVMYFSSSVVGIKITNLVMWRILGSLIETRSNAIRMNYNQDIP